MFLNFEGKKTLINSYFYLNFNYCPLVLMFSSPKSLNKVESLQTLTWNYHEGKMARKKKKKSQRLNESSNERSTSESASEKDEDSSQEEESSTSTIKRKPDSISPPESQPKPKITNCTTTPESISTEQNTSSNGSDDSPFHTTKSSDTSRDSHGPQIDESSLNSRIDTDDASHQVDAVQPMDISDEDEQTKISDP